MKQHHEALRLENQLCFPLYACSKEVVRRYRPLLEPLDLTYTQYIAMMVLWEKKETTVKDLGACLWLDSGTLTPVLKSLEAKGYLVRQRARDDARNVRVILTQKGEALAERAANIPAQMGACLHLSPEDAQQLYTLLYKVLSDFIEEA